MIVANVAKLIESRPLAEIQMHEMVNQAAKVMCDLDVGAVVVLDGRILVGVLSERDVIRKCVCVNRHTSETPVTEIMTPDPKTISSNEELARALEIMAEGGFHHVPVLALGNPVGLLSSDDIPEEYRMLLERYKEIRKG